MENGMNGYGEIVKPQYKQWMKNLEIGNSDFRDAIHSFVAKQLTRGPLLFSIDCKLIFCFAQNRQTMLIDEHLNDLEFERELIRA